MKYRTLTSTVLAIGALVTVAALLHGGGSASALLSGFTPWALAPYAVLLAATRLARTPRISIAVLVVSGLATAFGSVVYVDAMFLREGSTNSLVFLFIPLYQLMAAALLLGLLGLRSFRSDAER